MPVDLEVMRRCLAVLYRYRDAMGHSESHYFLHQNTGEQKHNHTLYSGYINVCRENSTSSIPIKKEMIIRRRGPPVFSK